MPNITQWTSQGLHSIQVGQRGASGYFAGWAGLDATDTDSQSSTRLLVGGITVPSPLPAMPPPTMTASYCSAMARMVAARPRRRNTCVATGGACPQCLRIRRKPQG